MKNHDYKTSNLIPYVILVVVIGAVIGVAYIFFDLWMETRLELTKQENMYNKYVMENEKWKKKQELFNNQKIVRGVWHETEF